MFKLMVTKTTEGISRLEMMERKPFKYFGVNIAFSLICVSQTVGTLVYCSTRV